MRFSEHFRREGAAVGVGEACVAFCRTNGTEWVNWHSTNGQEVFSQNSQIDPALLYNDRSTGVITSGFLCLPFFMDDNKILEMCGVELHI